MGANAMMLLAKSAKLLMALSLCILSFGIACAAEGSHPNPRAGIDFYVQTYGRVAMADIPNVYAVFEKVRAAADKSSLVTPQLVVVNDVKQASAFALSDGTIVLSTKALAIVRESATEAETQARLAFVLGHELAHLAANDFWDNQISQALLDSSTAKEFPAIELRAMTDAPAGQQKKELKADDLGFLYAALAGYDVDSVLESSRGNQDFLSFWNAQVGRRNDPNYPLPAQRSGLLRLRLAEMRNALNYFTFGVRLMHFGRYREAIGFFREFQQHYPGRELFNNVGYCHLRLAVNDLDPDYAYRYWLPMLSELDSPLSKLNTRSDPKTARMGPVAREHLLQAVRYFESAIEKDATYAPSYVNLAIAQLLLGMSGNSRALLDDNRLLRAKLAIGAALNLRINEAPTRMLAAIIDYELQAAEKSGSRVVRAASFANIDANDPAYLYNLAQLTRDDPARSDGYWQKLVGQFDSLPKQLQASICRRQNALASHANNVASCESLTRAPSITGPPWPLPVKLSRDLLDTPFTAGELRSHAWQAVNLASGIAYLGANDAVLSMDNIAVMAVIKPMTNAETLLKCCSQPLDKIPVVNGTLWHYGRWIALVRERNVEEVWVSN